MLTFKREELRQGMAVSGMCFLSQLILAFRRFHVQLARFVRQFAWHGELMQQLILLKLV